MVIRCLLVHELEVSQPLRQTKLWLHGLLGDTAIIANCLQCPADYISELQPISDNEAFRGHIGHGDQAIRPGTGLQDDRLP